jgi:hypothetical protein
MITPRGRDKWRTCLSDSCQSICARYSSAARGGVRTIAIQEVRTVTMTNKTLIVLIHLFLPHTAEIQADNICVEMLVMFHSMVLSVKNILDHVDTAKTVYQ